MSSHEICLLLISFVCLTFTSRTIAKLIYHEGFILEVVILTSWKISTLSTKVETIAGSTEQLIYKGLTKKMPTLCKPSHNNLHSY